MKRGPTLAESSGAGWHERPFTVSTAAEYLGCHEATVRALCRRGRLRHFRLGGLKGGPIRISADAMREFESCGSLVSGESITPTNAKTDNHAASRSAPPILTKLNGA